MKLLLIFSTMAIAISYHVNWNTLHNHMDQITFYFARFWGKLLPPKLMHGADVIMIAGYASWECMVLSLMVQDKLMAMAKLGGTRLIHSLHSLALYFI